MADLLREVAVPVMVPPSQTPHADPYRSTDADPCADPHTCPRPAPSLAPLCQAVHGRLRALSDRIEARGKASILPCTTNLRPSFLPGLWFLMSAVAACVAAGERGGVMGQG